MINFTHLGILLFSYLIFMMLLIQIKHDTSISNFTWGGGVMIVALYTLFVTNNYLSRPLLITCLIVLWAVRLIFYLYIRYTGKDPRFAQWKQEGIGSVVFNIVWIFLGQLPLLLIMSVPGFIVNSTINQSDLKLLDLLGLIIWVIGFSIESISDYQLFEFLNNPLNKGRIMRYGIWHYSRHPNYFGETLMWWGIFLIAINAPNGFYAIISPLVITILLRFFTGVPLLEKAMENNVEYQEYKKHTNIFVPWFIK